MRSATAAIYEAAGQPPITLYDDPGAATRAGSCRLCGRDGQAGYPWGQWIKDTFTDHDLLSPGDAICLACLFCADDHSLILQARTGRDKPQRMRNYSHVVTAGGDWLPYDKSQKRAMLAALCAGPRMAAISIAGQKHVLFRARLGQWQVEEQRCWPDPDRLAALVATIEALYATPPVTKAMIAAGEYGQRAILALGPDRWRSLEGSLRPARGSALFTLAVWLAQREEITDDPGARRGRGTPDADLARHPHGVQEQVQLHDLDAIRDASAKRGVHEHAAQVSQPDLFALERGPR